jgi:sugar diacid utilization regulator
MALEPQADDYKARDAVNTDCGLAADLALLASVLAGRRDELAEAMTDQIIGKEPAHEAHPGREALLQTCRAHLDALSRLPDLPRHKRAHEKVLARERERSALVGALLDGHIHDAHELWDTVEALRLPHDGPYVVVAAEILGVGEQEQIRVVENRLSMGGVRSAWRLQSDGHAVVAGIAAVHGTARLEALTQVLSAAWPHRAGISPRFQAMGGAQRALRFATLAMVGGPRGSAGVTVFDQAPVAVLAASAPDVMAEVAEVVLGSLNRLPDEERAVLVGTLRTWLACGGSVDAAAKTMFCHPNTVRYRLNRVTEHTGRSLTDPRAVTELNLALQADHLTRAI